MKSGGLTFFYPLPPRLLAPPDDLTVGNILRKSPILHLLFPDSFSATSIFSDSFDIFTDIFVGRKPLMKGNGIRTEASRP